MALVSYLTVIISTLAGSVLSYFANSTRLYGAVLVLLFIPYACGESVWAYLNTQLFIALDLRTPLLEGGTTARAFVVTVLCLGRAVSLGAFFFAVNAQAFSLNVRSYFSVHGLPIGFFVVTALSRIPKSLVILLGFFGAAIVANESSLPTFLYRANPGTKPELLNLVLAREFREQYGVQGPQTTPNLAVDGILIGAMEVAAAAAAATLAHLTLAFARKRLSRIRVRGKGQLRIVTIVSAICAGLVLLPGVLVLAFQHSGIRSLEFT